MRNIAKELSHLRSQNAGQQVQLELFRDAVEHMHHGLCMFDADGRIALCNSRYADVLQLPPEKVRAGVTIRELIDAGFEAGFRPPGETPDQLEARLWENLASSDTRNTITRGGRTYAVQPGRTAGGYWIATFEDVTAQVEAEAAVRQSEAQLRAFVDAMPDCVKIFDEAGTLIYINPKGLELLQAPDLETLVNTPGYQPVPPEYLAECLAVHRRVLAGESIVWTYEVVGMHGCRRHVEAHAVPFRLPDGAQAHLCISRDINERKEADDALRRSEERLRLVQDVTGLADFEAGEDGVAHFSPSLLKQMGLPEDNPTELAFEDWIGLVHPDDRERLRQVERSLSHTDTAQCEFRIQRADTGEIRWIASKLKMKHDEAGNIVSTIGAHLDITERKLAEEELRASEERLRLVQEATGFADFEAGDDGVTWVSERFNEQIGLPAGVRSLAPEEWLAIVHPDDRERFIRDIARSTASDDTFESEFRIVRPDTSEVRWIRSRTRLKLGTVAGAVNVIGAHLDITERRLAEDERRANEERLRLVHEATGLADFETDAKGVSLCSDRYFELCGLPIPSDRTMTVEQWAATIHPDDRERALAEVRAALVDRDTFGCQFRIVRADNGETRWISSRTRVERDQDGRIVRSIGALLDITEHKRAEEALRASEKRLRLVQEATGLADFESSANGLATCSDRFYEQFGLPVGDTAVNGKGWAELVHPDDRERIGEEIEGAIARGDESYSTEFRIIRADNGETRWISSNTKMERGPNGELIRTIGGHLDITERKESETALRLSEERLRLVQEATGLADFEARPGMICQLSDRFVEQAGLSPETTMLTLEEWLAVVHPGDRDQFLSHIMQNVDVDESVQFEFRLVRPDTGEVRWISSHSKLKRDASGKAIASIGAHLDITERKQAEEALRESEERFRLAAEATGLGVWDYDLALDQREWSDRLREILGIGPDVEPRLEVAEACIHPSDRARFTSMLVAARDTDVGRFEGSFRIRRASDGAERWVTLNGWRTYKTDSKLRRIIMTVRDVTEEKTAEERVRWTASHDTLTRLANRSLFQEKLEAAIEKAGGSGRAVGLLVLDMDHFKQINDSLGHDAGDMLLKMFAERLRGVVRPSDTVARLGGDEFAVVLPELDGELDLLKVARDIQQRLRDPFLHAGRILDCRASIGASLYPDLGHTPDELLKNADIALYAGKAAGRGIVTLFEPRMRDDVQRRNSMVQLARNAILDDRIVPYYQPKLDLAGRTLVGFEALLRWRNPGGRIASPAALEAAFEDMDVAAQISDRMIERVIADMRTWLDRGVDFKSVAVNASAAEFRRDNFAERLLEQLRRADIPTRCFQLEVTETVFLGRGAEYVHRALALLNMRGVRIALDDFGTGYASLRHLKQFPVDIIKIDQSFVRDMAVDAGDEAIIRAVINLGRSLGIKVVAEGIETEEQERRLLELECHFGQGFLFSRAVPASRVPSLVERWPMRRANAARPATRDLRLVANRD